MTRAIAMLTYIPAVLCGLLILGWLPSCWWTIGFCMPLGSAARLELQILSGRADLSYARVPGAKFDITYYRRYADEVRQRELDVQFHRPSDGFIYLLCLSFPILFWITLLVPLSLDPFTDYPLWCYLAYSALIVVEMAYYLG